MLTAIPIFLPAHLIMGRDWSDHISTQQAQSHEVQSHVALFVLHFIFCFVKALRWWGVTRYTQPHVHMYMFCPYVISTLYHLLEELQMRTFKRYFFSCNSSHNFTPKRNELTWDPWAKCPFTSISYQSFNEPVDCLSYNARYKYYRGPFWSLLHWILMKSLLTPHP
jgi:hypothetical protein